MWGRGEGREGGGDTRILYCLSNLAVNLKML